jgi:hypothetical protein
MSSERAHELNPRISAVVQELEELIRKLYPSTTFQVTRAEDDPQAVHLYATVDVEDTDAVVDLVIERLITLQVDEAVPVHVIPLRTPQARAAVLKQLRETRSWTPGRAMLGI